MYFQPSEQAVRFNPSKSSSIDPLTLVGAVGAGLTAAAGAAQPQESYVPPPPEPTTDYTPWIVGGIVVALGVGAFVWSQQKSKA